VKFADESIFVDLPNFFVVVPGSEVFLEAFGVLNHSILNAALNFSSFFIFFYKENFKIKDGGSKISYVFLRTEEFKQNNV